ncbi:MAG: two-component system, OmpR family, sensor kinase [Solirubrobacteraceae bacterium]|nr:two-component system, OmpR family, sensor kinase [Solirubrobacteraceae bacterium]
MRALGTLRARLAAATAASILAAVIVFAVVTVVVVGHELRGSLNTALRQRAQDVAQLAVSAPSVLQDPGALESPASGRQLAVEVIDARRRILARSLTLGARLLPQDALVRAAIDRGRTGFEDIRLDGRPWRMFVAPIADVGGAAAGGAVLVAANTSDIAHTLSNLGAVVAVSGIGVLLLAAIAAAMLTRRGLAPLRRLAVAAADIERTADPDQRLPEAGTLDEIGQLTGVLNRMLASLQTAREGERRLLADASHELRTPVTALLGNVEYAARYGADPEVLADLRHDAGRLARLVDGLLALERAAATVPVGTPVALDELIRELAAGQERVSVGPLPPAEVTGDEEALRRAIGNLIENGLVHGPPGGTVRVSLWVGAGVARVDVSDAGPGPDRDLHDRLFERFWRAPEASERPGSGLGLSIVAAIAERHRGRIEVTGSTFTVELPLSQHG